MPDSIEREMVVAQPREEVWTALTDPAALRSWFGDIAEVDLRPGGQARFGWTDYDSSYEALIEIVEPPTTFAFRWATLPHRPLADSPSTLVTFSLAEVEDGTRVTVIESGFSELPEDLRDRAFEENTSGWQAEFDDLREHLSAGGAS